MTIHVLKRNTLHRKQDTKTELTLNFMKTKCVVVSKRDSLRYEARISDVLIRQVAKFNYLNSVETTEKVTHWARESYLPEVNY